jgi:hypothetical protein
MARNFTREIRKALRPGVNRAVCSEAPYTGWEVEYSPRSSHDPQPWVLANSAHVGREKYGHGTDYRFTGRECHVQTFRYAVVESLGKFLVLDTEAAGSTIIHPTSTVTHPTGKGACEVAGVLASSICYTSRYAATDWAKRLEASRLTAAAS